MSEDTSGLPFCGPAGDLLSRIALTALPAEVPCAFTNLVACFPREAKSRGDNEPERGEIMECKPRLVEFVNIARPRLIVCVGSLAAQHVRHGDTIPCVDIIHPAYILARMPAAQKQFAVQKCVVQIRNAYEDALTANKPFQPWGVTDNAEVKTAKQKLRLIQTYLTAEEKHQRWLDEGWKPGSDDEIPF